MNTQQPFAFIEYAKSMFVQPKQRQTVDDVMQSFHATINNLENLVVENRQEAEAHDAEIGRLRITRAAVLAEAERAKVISNNLRSLVSSK